MLCKHEVIGSIPFTSTNLTPRILDGTSFGRGVGGYCGPHPSNWPVLGVFAPLWPGLRASWRGFFVIVNRSFRLTRRVRGARVKFIRLWDAAAGVYLRDCPGVGFCLRASVC